MSNILQTLSNELVSATERASRSVVRVDDRTRLTASGVVWAPGVIVATSHGVEADENVEIETFDGRRFPAQVVARDPDSDLAVLRTEAADLTPIQIAPESEVSLGQLVMAVGRPGEAGLHATLGVISAVTKTSQTHSLFHTDAVLYPGFSGAMLSDVQGRFVGLINLWYGRGRGVALGAEVVNSTVDALLTKGKVSRGYLGIRTQAVALGDTLKRALSTEQAIGLLVLSVDEGTGASDAGILLGDIILGIDGRSIDSPEDLRHVLRGKPAASRVSLELLRGGERRQVQAELGESQTAADEETDAREHRRGWRRSRRGERR